MAWGFAFFCLGLEVFPKKGTGRNKKPGGVFLLLFEGSPLRLVSFF